MLYDPLPPVLEQWLKLMGIKPIGSKSEPTPIKEMSFKPVSLDSNGEPPF